MGKRCQSHYSGQSNSRMYDVQYYFIVVCYFSFKFVHCVFIHLSLFYELPTPSLSLVSQLAAPASSCLRCGFSYLYYTILTGRRQAQEQKNNEKGIVQALCVFAPLYPRTQKGYDSLCSSYAFLEVGVLRALMIKFFILID